MKETISSIDICSKLCKSKCCRSTPPALTKSDRERIKEKTKLKNWYISIEKNQKTAYVVKKKNNSNDCIFLTEDGLCEIYDHRPLDCRFFPLLVKIKKQNKDKYNIKWLVWYCPLTENKGTDILKNESKEFLESILEVDPNQIFEYQEAMYLSRGYKKKHFFNEECLKIQKSDSLS